MTVLMTVHEWWIVTSWPQAVTAVGLALAIAWVVVTLIKHGDG